MKTAMQERRLAAIMFTDIVGYTALMGKDEVRAFEVLQKNREIHTILIEKHHGKLIKEIGDGILVSFNSSSDAVRCALEIQTESKIENISLKIGIHEGEMVFEGGDVHGDGVNIASRLQDITETGAITISDVVFRNVKNKPGIYTTYIGEKSLKNVDEPIKAFRVTDVEIIEEIKPPLEKPKVRKIIPYLLLGGIITIIVAAIFIWNILSEKPSDRKGSQASIIPDISLAVIPFRNDSPNPENEEWFCNGMLEDILNGLWKIGDLKVLSRTDVEPYRDTTLTRAEIARALGVSYLIEGSVRKYGNRFRMTVQLIDAENGFHLWSSPYEGELVDDPVQIFQIQSNIAEEVASALNIILTPNEEQRLFNISTTNLKAYELWARGRQEMSIAYWIKPPEKYHRTNLALDLFNEALALDPEYPEALAAKGEVFSHSRERFYDSTIYYCNRAMELNPEFSGAYWIRGFAYEMMQEFDLALKDYLKVTELAPNSPKIYIRIFNIYFEQKKDYPKALTYIDKYIEEEPWDAHIDAGHLYMHIGEYEKAEYHFFKITQTEGPYFGIHYYCITLGAQGKHQVALNFLDSISGSLSDIGEGLKNLLYHKKWVHATLLKEFELADHYYSLLVDSAGGIGWMNWDSIKLVYMYRNLGRDSLAEITLDKIRRSLEYKLKTDPDGHYPLIMMPSIYALLGDKKKAISYLSELVEQDYVVGGIQDEVKNSPLYENLWGDPEFEGLVKRMQEDKAAIRAQIREMEERDELEL